MYFSFNFFKKISTNINYYTPIGKVTIKSKQFINYLFIKRFLILKYGFYINLMYISYRVVNPIKRVKEFYQKGINTWIKETVNSDEIRGQSMKLVERLFKDKKLIDIQLAQLKKACLSKKVVDESKPFGKTWIVQVVKKPTFIKFSKKYFTDLVKTKPMIKDSSKLLELTVKEPIVIHNWAEVYKRGCMNHEDTLSALITRISKAGLIAVKDPEVCYYTKKGSMEICGSKKFQDQAWKNTLPSVENFSIFI